MAKVTGTFGATGVSSVIPGNKQGSMGLTLSGTWAATVDMQWSYDGGATWVDIDSYTANTNKVVLSPSDLILYRLECSAYTSGTVTYGLAS